MNLSPEERAVLSHQAAPVQIAVANVTAVLAGEPLDLGFFYLLEPHTLGAVIATLLAMFRVLADVVDPEAIATVARTIGHAVAEASS